MQALSHQFGEFVNAHDIETREFLTGSVIAISSPIRCNGTEMDEPYKLIKPMRDERGWSQPDLAERCNTSYQQISRLENGGRRITLDWAQRLGKAFGVDAMTFLPKDTLLTDEEIGWIGRFRNLTKEHRATIMTLTDQLQESNTKKPSGE